MLANDTYGLEDTARVFIYLLREDQRVRFVLRQHPPEIRNKIETFREWASIGEKKKRIFEIKILLFFLRINSSQPFWQVKNFQNIGERDRGYSEHRRIQDSRESRWLRRSNEDRSIHASRKSSRQFHSRSVGGPRIGRQKYREAGRPVQGIQRSGHASGPVSTDSPVRASGNHFLAFDFDLVPGCSANSLHSPLPLAEGLVSKAIESS